MIAGPLATHSPRAVREALEAAGWEPPRAIGASEGMAPAAVRLEGLGPEAQQALLRHAGTHLGLDVTTGGSWAIVAGSRARLSALARPWGGPPELAEVAFAVGMALPAEPPASWPVAGHALPLDQPVIMGILNTTPDSFSDGGRHLDPAAALARAATLVADGAMVLDVGGESTRPGAAAVPVNEELSRVLPVVEALVREWPGVPVSVDTVKAEVARAALDAGAAIVNDVSALRLDPDMGRLVAATGAGLVLMHSRGDVATMASVEQGGYPAGVTTAVLAELRAALDGAMEAGVGPDRVVVDPGLGFSKDAADSRRVLDQLAALQALGRPVLVGPSRKRFLGDVTGRPVEDRDRATAAACVMAWERGARLFRVHEPAAVRDALAVAAAVAPA